MPIRLAVDHYRLRFITSPQASIFPAYLGLEHVAQSIFDFLVGFVNFLVGKGAFGSLVGQGVRQALLAGGDAGALVEIEESTAGGQLPAGRANLRLRARGGNRCAEKRGTI